MKPKLLLPNLLAFGTITIWGLTFVSTKILLAEWTPLEILFIRFTLGWLALCLLERRRLQLFNGKYEILFVLAGLSGVTLYFLLENVALTYTLAANVSVIVSTTPFFTGILSWRLLGAPWPGANFFLGFLMALGGIYLVSFGTAAMTFNPAGDILALLAALAWAFYSILTRKLTDAGFASIAATRRIFFYGLALMLPVIWIEPFSLKFASLIKPVYLFNFLFLGLGASALCFASWTWCVKRLGADQASAWIYLVPVVTVLAATQILAERLGPGAILGIILTLAGLAISEQNFWRMISRFWRARRESQRGQSH